MPIRVPPLLCGIGIYIKEFEKQLGDKDIYEELCIDPGPLVRTTHKSFKKIGKGWNLMQIQLNII